MEPLPDPPPRLAEAGDEANSRMARRQGGRTRTAFSLVADVAALPRVRPVLRGGFFFAPGLGDTGSVPVRLARSDLDDRRARARLRAGRYRDPHAQVVRDARRGGGPHRLRR